jgi:hypothetical protein
MCGPTYGDHGEQYEAGGGGFLGAAGGVDEGVDGRGCEDDAGGQVADDLGPLAIGAETGRKRTAML